MYKATFNFMRLFDLIQLELNFLQLFIQNASKF